MLARALLGRYLEVLQELEFLGHEHQQRLALAALSTRRPTRVEWVGCRDFRATVPLVLKSVSTPAKDGDGIASESEN